MLAPKDILFGRLAISMGFLTREQLDEAVKYQKERAPNCPLGLVLVDKGFIQAEDLQELISAQKEAFQLVDPTRMQKIEDAIFGQIAVKENLLQQDAVHQALRDQAIEVDTGGKRRIGEILVELGLLSAEQVEWVLAVQRRRFVVCSGCGAQFNIEKLEPGKKFKCGKCKATLEAPMEMAPLPPPPPPPKPEIPETPGLDSLGLSLEDSASAAGLGDLESLENGLTASLSSSTIPADLEELDNKPTGSTPRPAAVAASSEDAGPSGDEPRAEDATGEDEASDEAGGGGEPFADYLATLAGEEAPAGEAGSTGEEVSPEEAGAGEALPAEEPPPEEDSLPDLSEDLEDLESAGTMAMPTAGAGTSRPRAQEPVAEEEGEEAVEAGDEKLDLEDMRTMALPAVGSVGKPAGKSKPAAAPPAEDVDIESMRTMALPGVGRAADEAEGVSVGDADELMEGMTTMPIPSISADLGVEDMRTIATPGLGRTSSRKIDPNATITFQCSCGKSITAPAKMAGKAGKCPKCGKKILLPKALARQVAGSESGVVAKPPSAARSEAPTKARARFPRKERAESRSAEPATDGNRWPVTYVAGSLPETADAGIRGPGTFALDDAGVSFSGGSKRLSLLTFVGAPLCLAAGGGALALELLPMAPAIAGGAAGAVVLALVDFLMHRRKGGAELALDRTAVREYKSEPKPKVSFALNSPDRGAVCVTFVPRPADRKRMLQILSERF